MTGGLIRQITEKLIADRRITKTWLEQAIRNNAYSPEIANYIIRNRLDNITSEAELTRLYNVFLKRGYIKLEEELN